MFKIIAILCTVLFLHACKTTSYYVVRHAERDNSTMSSDVPLSEAGKQRAEALKETLKDKKIGTIYTTNFIRTRSTAQPLADHIGLTMQVYDHRDSTFISRIVNTGNKDNEGNILIVGHSNTVDDIVNKMVGQAVLPGDLPDSQYGDLFVIKQRGKKFSFEKKRYGQ